MYDWYHVWHGPQLSVHLIQAYQRKHYYFADRLSIMSNGFLEQSLHFNIPSLSNLSFYYNAHIYIRPLFTYQNRAKVLEMFQNIGTYIFQKNSQATSRGYNHRPTSTASEWRQQSILSSLNMTSQWTAYT